MPSSVNPPRTTAVPVAPSPPPPDNTTVGTDWYPSPAADTDIAVTTPDVIVAVADASTVGSPPTIPTVGAVV